MEILDMSDVKRQIGDCEDRDGLHIYRGLAVYAVPGYPAKCMECGGAIPYRPATNRGEKIGEVRVRRRSLRYEAESLRVRLREIDKELDQLDGLESNLCGGGWGS